MEEQKELDFGFSAPKPLYLDRAHFNIADKSSSESDTTNETEKLDLLEKYINKVSHESERAKIDKNTRMELLKKLFDNHDAVEPVAVKSILIKYPEFLTSPASAKFHGAYEGGLFDHSIGVYYAALRLGEIYGFDHLSTDKNVDRHYIDAIAVIFHDLCKVGLYKNAKKWKKDESTGNKWVQCDSYDYNNEMPTIQHGPESLRRLFNCSQYCEEPWQLAIAYHMSVFDAGEDEKAKYSKMCELYPEVLLLHQADMISTKLYRL